MRETLEITDKIHAFRPGYGILIRSEDVLAFFVQMGCNYAYGK